MDGRDVLKGLGGAAGAMAATAAVETASSPQAAAQVPGGVAAGNAAVEIKPIDAEYFVPGRFSGKTFIVTGSARGMASLRFGSRCRERLASRGRWSRVIGFVS